MYMYKVHSCKRFFSVFSRDKYSLALLVVIALLITTISVTRAATLGSKDFSTQIDKTAKERIEQSGVIGMSLAVLVDGKLKFKKAFGKAELNFNTPMTTGTLLPVASISKLVSSIALNTLLLEKEVHVNTSIGNLLDKKWQFPSSWKGITVGEILSHTSGLPDTIDYGLFLTPESVSQVIQVVGDRPFTFPPGTDSRYNATGYMIVKMLIEELAGQSFEAHMKSTYFSPLDMEHTNYGGFLTPTFARATVYRNIDEELKIFPLDYSPTMYAGAGLNSSLDELVKWTEALLSGKLIERESLEKIWPSQPLKNGEDGAFGLGWHNVLDDKYLIVGHGGVNIHSFRHYIPKNNSGPTVTIILLTNGALNWTQSPYEINKDIADTVFDLLNAP